MRVNRLRDGKEKSDWDGHFCKIPRMREEARMAAAEFWRAYDAHHAAQKK